MLTFRDYKVKTKKIVNILIPSIVRVGIYKYKGYIIYENLYGYDDFYYATKTGKCISGSYRQLTELIDHSLTSPPVKIHARHTPPPPEVKFYARNTLPPQKR